MSADKRVVGLNSMLQSGKLTLFQASGELVYKVANKDVKWVPPDSIMCSYP